MNLHGYQARELFRAAGMAVNPGEVARDPGAVRSAAERYGGSAVVKAQVHSGGRGKAGGVKLAHSPEEAAGHARTILGMTIRGLTVREVLVSPIESIASEAHAGVLVDREGQCPVFMVSAEGGVDIEEVAATDPKAIHRLRVDPRYGLLPHQAYRLATRLYEDPGLAKQGARAIAQLSDVFVANGASMAEINPLVSTSGGRVKAIDAKVSIDDNELFRRPRRGRAARPRLRVRGGQAGPRGGAELRQARRQRAVSRSCSHIICSHPRSCSLPVGNPLPAHAHFSLDSAPLARLAGGRHVVSVKGSLR